MKMSYACLCVLIAAVVAVSAIKPKLPVADVPSSPKFPQQFSTSVVSFISFNNEPMITYSGRWFNDAKLQKERFDYTGENRFQVNIRDGVADMGYSLMFQDDEVACQEYNSTYVPYVPDFSEYVFSGIVMVHLVPTNSWYYVNETSNTTFVYYDNVKSREPVRFREYFDVEGMNYVTSDFYEMDVGAQDPSLFVLSDPLQALCDSSL